MTYPRDLQYTREHEWARLEGDVIRVGIAGLNGMGWTHVGTFSAIEGVRVAAICDPDRGLLARRREEFEKDRTDRLQTFTDIRKPNIVQNEIYRQVEGLETRKLQRLGEAAAGGAAAPAAPAPASIPEQIEQLDRLRREGVLTDEEFAAQNHSILFNVFLTCISRLST